MALFLNDTDGGEEWYDSFINAVRQDTTAAVSAYYLSGARTELVGRAFRKWKDSTLKRTDSWIGGKLFKNSDFTGLEKIAKSKPIQSIKKLQSIKKYAPLTPKSIVKGATYVAKGSGAVGSAVVQALPFAPSKGAVKMTARRALTSGKAPAVALALQGGMNAYSAIRDFDTHGGWNWDNSEIFSKKTFRDVGLGLLWGTVNAIDALTFGVLGMIWSPAGQYHGKDYLDSRRTKEESITTSGFQLDEGTGKVMIKDEADFLNNMTVADKTPDGKTISRHLTDDEKNDMKGTLAKQSEYLTRQHRRSILESFVRSNSADAKAVQSLLQTIDDEYDRAATNIENTYDKYEKIKGSSVSLRRFGNADAYFDSALRGIDSEWRTKRANIEQSSAYKKFIDDRKRSMFQIYKKKFYRGVQDGTAEALDAEERFNNFWSDETTSNQFRERTTDQEFSNLLDEAYRSASQPSNENLDRP